MTPFAVSLPMPKTFAGCGLENRGSAMQMATINGIAMHYRDEGPQSSATLVFVNSLGTDFRIWDGVAAAFCTTHRVVRYDKRGHGLTDVPPAPYAIADHIADLAGLLDHLGIERAVFVGLSVGGLIVTGLAGKSPERVAALVLCATAHKIGTSEVWNARIAEVETRGIASISAMVLERWFSPAFHADRKSELAICRNMLEAMPVAGYAGTCAALRDADHTQIVKALKMPVLLMVGSNDGSTPPDLVRSTHQLIAGSRFVILHGPGHIPCVEAPAETTALITAFLAEHHLG